MRFHVPALPGQPLTRDNSTCAYTGKVRRFALMMAARGHRVYVYTDARHDLPEDLVDVVTCYEETEPVEFTQRAWAGPNHAALLAIGGRAEPGDFLCLIGGDCQQKLAVLLDDTVTPVEFGIGYGGSFADFRVFESYAWMHSTYAQQNTGDAHAVDGRAFDAVIPNYFDPDDFPGGPGGDHVLYLGRLIERKGVEVAVQAAMLAGVPITLAGEGDYRPFADEPDVSYIGAVGPMDRAALLGTARAVLAPTTYIEPFGGAAVEAQLCGTPAITTDWGAYAETVIPGVTGYRCRRLGEFAWAIRHAADLSRDQIRAWAQRHYTLDAVAPLYERYFEHLTRLRGAGWYDPELAPPMRAGVAPPA